MMTEKEKHDYVEMAHMLFLAQMVIMILFVVIILTNLKK